MPPAGLGTHLAHAIVRARRSCRRADTGGGAGFAGAAQRLQHAGGGCKFRGWSSRAHLEAIAAELGRLNSPCRCHCRTCSWGRGRRSCLCRDYPPRTGPEMWEKDRSRQVPGVPGAMQLMYATRRPDTRIQPGDLPCIWNRRHRREWQMGRSSLDRRCPCKWPVTQAAVGSSCWVECGDNGGGPQQAKHWPHKEGGGDTLMQHHAPAHPFLSFSPHLADATVTLVRRRGAGAGVRTWRARSAERLRHRMHRFRMEGLRGLTSCWQPILRNHVRQVARLKPRQPSRWHPHLALP